MALMGAENRINNCITLFLPSARMAKKKRSPEKRGLG